MGIADRVCWAGDVPNARVPDLIKQARVLVFPTWCESFGLPLAEALAMGAPAVAADIPACREVGGDAAAYYQPGSVDSLVTTLEPLVNDEPASECLAKGALARGQQFSWRDNAVTVRQTLEWAMRGRP
jgi:glycosyltransferase involved in cell wall biosynthesis